MILKLTDAQLIDPNINQGKLDGIESAIRTVTNNKFQRQHIRGKNLVFSGNIITIVHGNTLGMSVGDTVEINDSVYNDGLYVIESLTPTSITVVEPSRELFGGSSKEAIVTLVLYPSDVVDGVKKLIQYDLKMAPKLGIKSEAISRMSVTYYDLNASDNEEGYPSALLSFLNKYKKMRWD